MDDIGLYDALFEFINSNDVKTKILSLELLKIITESDPSGMRSHIMLKLELLAKLIKIFVEDIEPTVKNEISDLITSLLESQSPESEESSTPLINIFYKDYAYELFKPLIEIEDKDISPGDPNTYLIYKLLQLASSFIFLHGLKMRQFFINKNILGKSKWIIGGRNKELTLEYLSLLRTCIGTKLKDLTDHIVKEDLFKTVIDLYLVNKSRNNLITSALLELFQFINDLKSARLIKYIMSNYYSLLFDIKETDIFQNLKKQYDQILNQEKINEIAYFNIIKENEKYEQAMEEERYFEDDFDDDEEEEDERESLKRERNDDADDSITTPKKKKKF